MAKAVHYLLGLTLLLPLSAGAQDATVSQDREDAKTSAVTATVDPKDATTMSPKQLTERVESMLVEMRGALRRVTDLYGEAQSAKDIVQLNCVNEKLTQVKGLVRVAEESSTKLYDAIASNLKDSVVHEYTKIAVAHQKVLVLRAESEQCVGEFSVYTGDTEVTVEIDSEIPVRDATTPEPPPPGPEVPPVASSS
ncbi:hypothetical protein L6R52_21480 [Myxococcota bacterium]|nr:hypothetical protein [Myxococcota bacterium]